MKTMHYTLNSNPARAALTRAINASLAAGNPVYVNVPAPAPSSLTSRVRAALITLNDHYGYGAVKTVRVFMDGRVEFGVQGFRMRPQLRRGHLDGYTVHALGHQRALDSETFARLEGHNGKSRNSPIPHRGPVRRIRGEVPVTIAGGDGGENAR